MHIQITSSAQHAGSPATDADSRFSRNFSGLLASFGFVALLSLSQNHEALAATAPNLASTFTYAVVSGTYTNANTAPQTIINGTATLPAVCYTTAPVTPPLVIIGTTLVPCPPATGTDQGLALANLNGQACVSLGAGAITLDSVIIGANPPGTIPPGCYSSGGAMNVTATTTVTLNGAGVYVFRPGGALTTGANSSVILTNGACANDVFWAPVSATTIGANAALSPTPTFVGTILDAAGINIGHFANLTGRALAFGGTVTTDAVTMTVPTCIPFGGGIFSLNPTAGPTLSEWAMVLLTALLALAGAAALRRQEK